MAALAVCVLLAARSADAQDGPAAYPASPPANETVQPSKPDTLTKAFLFGAAYAQSDLSTDHPGGVMFLPGRGLIRWETWGKTPEEQEELKTEAIGAADARAVQAELDARAAMQAADDHRSAEAMELREHRRLLADSRAASDLSLGTVTGTRRQAGGAAGLNRAALQSQIAGALGVRNGAQFKDKSRVYLFGAVSGRGVGMNLMHDGGAGWTNGGLSTDKGGFVGQRQAGLALRKGGVQASISYVQEKTNAQVLGITSVKDHRAMLNFTFVPKFGGH